MSRTSYSRMLYTFKQFRDYKQNLLNYKPKNKLFNDLINLQIKELLKKNELAKSIDVLEKLQI